MFKFTKYNSLHIVFLTSYSSQLSFCFAQHQFISEKKKNLNSLNDLYIVFLYPSTSDPKAENRAALEKFFFSKKENFHSDIKIIKIINIWKRILVSPFLYLLRLTILNPIFIWESRYEMLEDSLEFAPRSLLKIKFKLPVPKFKIILFGDGFLSLMPVSRPFWLEQKQKEIPLSHKRLFKSYHLYSAGNNINAYKSNKLNRKDIISKLRFYIENNLDKNISKFLSNYFELLNSTEINDNLYIFPTTTFYETGRSNLREEISLYKSFLKNSKLDNCTSLIIKPHPGSSYEKNMHFYRELKSDKHFKNKKIFNPYTGSNKLQLSNIPLELIFTFFYYHFNKNNLKKSIILACCSTAGLSIKNLFPSTILDFAFGDLLIRKFINKDYQEKRITQEILIRKYIDQL
tara:strand:+ start:927 stop:2132 length:1206 start_codon:yes stop_codon:yes gene_type:complete